MAYLILEILCFFLIAGSFAEVQNFDDIVVSFMYTVGYLWMISCDINFVRKQPKIEIFVEKLCELFYENDEALPFIDSACIKCIKIVKFMAYLEVVSLNFGIILIPLLFRTLLLPMWKFSDVSGNTGVTLCLLLQALSIDFVIFHISAVIIFWYCLMILINGYAQFLSFKLRTLVSGGGYDGIKDLKECIEIHLKLRR